MTIRVDQNGNYVKTIRRECGQLRNGHDENHKALQAVHGDSRNMGFVKNDSVGLIVTSPPYWDKAHYGKSKKNLGNRENYVEFLTSLSPVFQECMRVLMPGEVGYGPVLKLSDRLPSPGGGLPRPVIGLAELAGVWHDCPLLHLPEADSEEM